MNLVQLHSDKSCTRDERLIEYNRVTLKKYNSLKISKYVKSDKQTKIKKNIYIILIFYSQKKEELTLDERY